mmetsp:Transcript_41809/g.122304  ORF Transcript_41809/g.122304 Transcript_41809/m.122304 type:complete len:203 (+) Transcript_41809:1988-2596(+)
MDVRDDLPRPIVDMAAEALASSEELSGSKKICSAGDSTRYLITTCVHASGDTYLAGSAPELDDACSASSYMSSSKSLARAGQSARSISPNSAYERTPSWLRSNLRNSSPMVRWSCSICAPIAESHTDMTPISTAPPFQKRRSLVLGPLDSSSIVSNWSSDSNSGSRVASCVHARWMKVRTTAWLTTIFGLEMASLSTSHEGA